MPTYYDESKKTYFCKFYYVDWTGQRKQKLKRGFPRSKDAKAWEREFLQKQQGSPDMTFQALYNLYIADMEHRLKESTMQNKKYTYGKHIVPYFKDKTINQITAVDIRNWQNKIISSGFKETYQRQIYNQLNAVLNFAVTYYNLPQNPCKITGSIGKLKAEEMDFWTLNEFNCFIPKVRNITMQTVFYTLYYTGMRYGELLALNMGDINLQNGAIAITKTFHRIKKRDVITSPKTEDSKRIVTAPPFLIELIKQYIEKNYDMQPEERLFPVTRSKIVTSMKHACEDSKVKMIRIHDIRHSHVSLLIEMGFSPLLIAERIGDSVEMVNKTYGHLYPNKHNEVVDKLQLLVSK